MTEIETDEADIGTFTFFNITVMPDLYRFDDKN